MTEQAACPTYPYRWSFRRPGLQNQTRGPRRSIRHRDWYHSKDEKDIGDNRVLELKADLASILSPTAALFITPKEQRLVRLELDLKVPYSKGKYTMSLDQPIANVWLPIGCTGFFDSNSPGLFPDARLNRAGKPPCHYLMRFSREFYDFKKSEVKAKFWFEGLDVDPKAASDK